MNREYHRWYSSRLHRDMELLVFGHAGPKVLVFPTREGTFHEYEDLRIIASLEDPIRRGQLQVYCVEGLAHETFYCSWMHPADRIRRHRQYEEYILNEVLPLMALKNSDPTTISHGCSLGAYLAANIAFRHPHLFRKLVAFSGRYDLTQPVECFDNLLDGHYDDEVYFNTPAHFLSNSWERPQIDALRSMEVVLAVGREDPFLASNESISRMLADRGVRHELHIWDGRAHQAGAWRRMAQLYIG